MSSHEDKAQESDSTKAAEIQGHEYDGIREYDNPMPRWWIWIFWGTFYFSLVYYVHYQLTGNGTTLAQAYETDIAEAREKEASRALGGGVSESALAQLAQNQGMMADAQKLFVQKCSPCHGQKAEGLIGPNLTDAYWLHGDATLMSVFGIISEGVTNKGMPAWNRQLKPIEMSKLAAYLGSIRNTNVPGPKGQEGTLIEPNQAAVPAATQAAPKTGG